MNDYRVIVINHSTGEMIEHQFPTLDLARVYEMGIVSALGIVWDFDCEYHIERRVETWERVPDEDDTISPDDITDEEIDEFADFTDDDGECLDYLCEGNAPCDNIGHCIGRACKYYRNCH